MGLKPEPFFTPSGMTLENTQKSTSHFTKYRHQQSIDLIAGKNTDNVMLRHPHKNDMNKKGLLFFAVFIKSDIQMVFTGEAQK